MTFRAIGELVGPILARCNDMTLLHLHIRTKRTAEERKETILNFRAAGAISDDETALLIEAYALETA